MAHDLRSPLGAIHVWLELLRAQGLDPSGARALAMIDRSLRDLNDLLGQFLDLSRLLAGELRLEKHATDLVALVDSVTASAGEAAQRKDVRLERGGGERSLPPLPADAQRLRSALECLVVNAVKGTPPGGRVEVTIESTPARVQIRVRDTGPAIPAEELAGVFDDFRSGTAPGGLALAIAQRVVRLHGGEVRTARTDPGPGNVFVLDLPRRAPGSR